MLHQPEKSVSTLCFICQLKPKIVDLIENMKMTFASVEKLNNSTWFYLGYFFPLAFHYLFLKLTWSVYSIFLSCNVANIKWKFFTCFISPFSSNREISLYYFALYVTIVIWRGVLTTAVQKEPAGYCTIELWMSPGTTIARWREMVARSMEKEPASPCTSLLWMSS